MPKRLRASARGLCSRGRSAAGRSAAGSLVIALVVLVWLRIGVESSSIGIFVLAWVVLLLAPGVVLLRALDPTPRSRSAEVALGAATGICTQIVAWLCLAPLGMGSLAIGAGPATAVVVFLIPKLRRRTLGARTLSTGALDRWLIAAVSAITVTVLGGVLRYAPLPPQGGQQYIDTYWHLALIHASSHGAFPEEPQFFGHPLHYHYFAHVHIALLREATGISPELLLLRLWIFPVVLTAIYGIAALVRLFSSDQIAPALAAALAFGGVTLSLTTLASTLSAAVAVQSPSQVLASALVPALGCGFVGVCRGRFGLLPSLWLLILVLGSMGAKSSVIPVVASGTIGAAIYSAWRQRDLVRRLVPWLGTLVFLLIVAIPRIAGTSGGKISILSSLNSMRPYSLLVDHALLRGVERGLFVDSITSLSAFGAAVLTLLYFAVTQLLQFLGLAAVKLRGPDAAATWWLAAAGLSGYALMFLVDHLAFAQSYFAITSLVYLSALSGIAFARFRGLLGGSAMMVISILIGIILSFYWLPVVRSLALRRDLEVVWLPIIAVVGVLLLPLGIAAAVRHYRPVTVRLAYVIALYGVVLGLTLPGLLRFNAQHLAAVLRPGPVSLNVSAALASTGEQQAMLWLRSNSEGGDRQVTNLHCVPPATVKNCDARGFWVVGLSGVPAALEGWGYTADAFARHGVGGVRAEHQSAPRSPAADLSVRFFADPSDRSALELRDRFSVDWVVAVRRAGDTTALAKLTALDLAFDNGEVAIYRIKQ